MAAKPDTTAQDDAPATAPVPVIEIVPVDPGDAHGIGNAERAPIRADLLHETAEDAAARGSAWRRP